MKFITVQDVQWLAVIEARDELTFATRYALNETHVTACRIALAHAEAEYWGSDRIPEMEG